MSHKDLETDNLGLLLEYGNLDFLSAAYKAFKIGEVGPKKYEPHSWKELDMDSTQDILPSLLGHIAHCEKGIRDPDTGLDPELFVAARAIMYVVKKIEERQEKNNSFYGKPLC